jgi:hypothetical protein
MRLANARTNKVPREIPIEKAVLVGPYSCSKHAVDRAQIGLEDIVVISGCGTLGLGMVGILCELRGKHIDRCVLYVFRCAVYFAAVKEPVPELLKWWNWKDK